MEVDSWSLTIIMQYLMHHLHVGFGSMLAFTHAAQSAQTGHSPCDQIRFVSTHVVTGFLQRSPSTTSNHMYLQVENELYVRRNTFPGRLGDAYIMSHVHVYPW